MKGCKNCPAYAKCTVTYRGSACAALRSTYGIDTDPDIITNADRIRAMSDEELANTMYSNPIFIVCDAVCKGDCAAIDTLNDTKEDACKRTILEWLRQPSEEGT